MGDTDGRKIEVVPSEINTTNTENRNSFFDVYVYFESATEKGLNMSKPTKEQIKEEIKNLKSIVDKVRLFSIFGNDNRANARAAIEVMEKDIDKNDIYQAWPDDEEGDERFNDERDTALTTRKWMDGEGEADFSPYNDFKGLVQ